MIDNLYGQSFIHSNLQWSHFRFAQKLKEKPSNKRRYAKRCLYRRSLWMGSGKATINLRTYENWSEIEGYCKNKYERVLFKITCCFHHYNWLSIKLLTNMKIKAFIMLQISHHYQTIYQSAIILVIRTLLLQQILIPDQNLLRVNLSSKHSN